MLQLRNRKLDTMTDTGIVEPAVVRPRSSEPETVSATALAEHLDCSRTYIGKLEAEGVIQRQGDGFPVDQSPVAYVRYLRRERSNRRAARLTLTTSRPSKCCICG